MPDNIFLSNDTVGYNANEETFVYNFASETSVLNGSATLIPVGIAKANGRVSKVVLGVVRPVLSATGFVSGTTDLDVLINSATCMSTLPAIGMAAASANAVRTATNKPGVNSAAVVSGVVNAASANFSAGDQIAINYNARSVGSAAVGATGVGLYAAVTVRYAAN